MRSDAEVRHVVPQRQYSALDLTAGIGMDRKPAEPCVGTEIGRFRQASRIQLDTRRNSSRMDIVRTDGIFDEPL